MEIDQPIVSVDHTTNETDYIIPKSSVLIKNRLRRLFGFPKLIDDEQTGHEHCSWSYNTLLCACVFLEDAVTYKSIVHKVTKSYLYIYRWFSCPFIRKFHRIALTINLCLAFFEQPSSFSRTSDVRDQPIRMIFPPVLLMFFEGLTLIWFLIYICTKIACHGVKRSRKHFWFLAFLFGTIYSLAEWFAMTSVISMTYHGIRYRRLFRPLFLIESSQLMKKALKSVQKDLLTIIACVSLALALILFFGTIAMFLFPESDTQPTSQGSIYFPSLHDSVYNFLVLYSTANNPDVMMPAYSDNRLNVLFFVVFVIIGIYWIQNLITAVVYRAFRGYFLNSIINSQLRRRVAVKASFEVLKKRMSNTGTIETKDTVPICIVQTIVNAASIDQWHINRITQRLNELQIERETIDYEQYSTIMQLLDLNPKLLNEIELQTLGNTVADRIKTIGRSKIFDNIGTFFALLSVTLTTIEVTNRHIHVRYHDLVGHTLAIAFFNFSLMIFFVFEIILKAWSFGVRNFFRSSLSNSLEAAVAFITFILQIVHLAIYGTLVVPEHDFELTENQLPFLTLWEMIKACSMLFIYRLVRFLPASTNIQIVIGTVFDEIRNGGAFFGVVFSFYYVYSILGMELFGGVIERLYNKQNETNLTICGTYQQLEYWTITFDDFFASIVTLYNIMIVNQWFVIVNAYREATETRWSELYFIIWYLFITTIGLNICLALSGDIYDAKKKRANEHEELIVSNMFDIYRSLLNEPPDNVIIKQLNAHPYINFHENRTNEISIA